MLVALAFAGCPEQPPRPNEFDRQGQELEADPLFSIPVPGGHDRTFRGGVRGVSEAISNHGTATWTVDKPSEDTFAAVLRSARSTGVQFRHVICDVNSFSSRGEKEIRGRSADVLLSLDVGPPFRFQIDMSVDDYGSPEWPPPSFAVVVPSTSCPDSLVEAAGIEAPGPNPTG